MTDKLTVEQMALAQRLKGRVSDADAERIAGRQARIKQQSKRWDDFDAGRGVDLKGPVSVALLNQRMASAIDDQQTFLLDVMADVIVKAVNPILKRIESLEAQLEQRKYFGVWDNGDYKAHNMVTHSGSLWIALIDTAAQPGASDDWQLAAKRGRDGRDAR